MYGTIQTGSESYSSLVINYHLYFFRNKGKTRMGGTLAPYIAVTRAMPLA